MKYEGIFKMHSEDDDHNLPVSFATSYITQLDDFKNLEFKNWRLKERMKTVSVALVLALNIGVDPPDVVKIEPCARLECWFDPSSVAAQKSIEVIGSTLQKQYERWQPKARYKQSLDPTAEDVKKLCMSLRRNAKEERVLFHFNGHGVPKPTSNGEIWVFNRTYTQYIPLSIYDLQTWMGAPSIYVWDCSNAGLIVQWFNIFAEQHETELVSQQANRSASPQSNSQQSNANLSFKNCIQLAACSSTQILPMNAELPADLFTSCLTTPIKTALKWFSLRPTKKLVPHVTCEMIDKLPGVLNDRRTMLGELNWIFTAITDTIAWNTLPRDLFQTLFRQDLLVASLFRNFLLADRILRSYGCTPISSPPLPNTFRHQMWAAWDLALDLALSKLPDVLSGKKAYLNSSFFEEQLTAFDVWLKGNPDESNPPEQLPIVLQVLLSQAHRIRALELLEKFLDIGGWAVNLALNVGIFPYVLRLLQSPAVELRPYLVFIWAKILAVDYTCQVDIVREAVDSYFLNALLDKTLTREDYECRLFAGFVTATIVYKFEQGQSNALKGQLVSTCLEQIANDAKDPMIRKWFVICLGNLWYRNEAVRWAAARDLAYEKLFGLLKDSNPEVRAGTVYALGTFINSTLDRTNHANDLDRQIAMHMLDSVSNDMSPLVRMEVVSALQWIIKLFDTQFVDILHREDNQGSGSLDFGMKDGSWKRNSKLKPVSSEKSLQHLGVVDRNFTHSLSSSVNSKILIAVVQLSRDPFPQVSKSGCLLIDYIRHVAAETTASSVIPGKEVICDRSSPCSSNSFSLPPSPLPKSYTDCMGGSHSGSTVKLNDSTNSVISATKKTESCHKLRISIVKTSFVERQIASMSRPMKELKKNQNPDKIMADQFSFETLDRRKRFIRNEHIRQEGVYQQRAAIFHNLKSQAFIGKTPMTPTLVKLHPYDHQIAVAYSDKLRIYDWFTNVQNSFSPILQPTQLKSNFHTTLNPGRKLSMTSYPMLRLSSVQFVNAHIGGLVMTGYDDGSIRIWRNSEQPINNNNGITSTDSLVTAFQALDDQPQRSAKIYGLQTAWHQSTQTIFAGGESKYIRLWDAEKEYKTNDISTGSDSFVSHLCCSPNAMFAVALADGCIQLYDRRIPTNDSRIMVYREHISPLLTICMRNDCESLISGGSDGEIRLFDIRNKVSVQHWSAGSEITSISIHQNADIIACAGQYISIHGLDGTQIGTIQSHEGFMGSKLGQSSCLSFHPHKVSLAAGFVDNYVSVYTIQNDK